MTAPSAISSRRGAGSGTRPPCARRSTRPGRKTWHATTNPEGAMQAQTQVGLRSPRELASEDSPGPPTIVGAIARLQCIEKDLNSIEEEAAAMANVIGAPGRPHATRPERPPADGLVQLLHAHCDGLEARVFDVREEV